jgi:hypothetical protein
MVSPFTAFKRYHIHLMGIKTRQRRGVAKVAALHVITASLISKSAGKGLVA